MTEDDAREEVRARLGGAAVDMLEALVALVLAENRRQNLIAPASEAVIWSRHVLDSIQLLGLAGSWSTWLDVGTGGGFPGLVIGAVSGRRVTLVEPRRRRADFLEAAAAVLGVREVKVIARRIEQVEVTADVISARAVAPLEKLLPAAHHCATTATIWLLPRGRLGQDELVKLSAIWKGMFHVERSLTDERSSIVVARGVARR